MKKAILYLFVFLFSTVPSITHSAEVVVVTPRQCVEYSLVQYDLKFAVDNKAPLEKFPFPKTMSEDLKAVLLKVTSDSANADTVPLDFAHNFLDFCMKQAGHFPSLENL